MRQFILFYSLLVIPGWLFAQEPIMQEEEMLGKLYYRLSLDLIDSDKTRINDSITRIIDYYSGSDSVFKHRFYTLRYLGQIISPDSLLKIITWNLNLREGAGKYFCYFIKKNPERNTVYKLTADYHENTPTKDTTYSAKNWYGALYYDLKPIAETNSKSSWVLLGLDYGNPLISRKIVDVLSFDDKDSPVFGSKCFETDKGIKFREVFEYASSATMTLRFTSDTSIVFDHLVPFSPEMINNRRFYGPDYSYDALLYRNGKWEISINVDARNRELK
jgi:hypothetical protein